MRVPNNDPLRFLLYLERELSVSLEAVRMEIVHRLVKDAIPNYVDEPPNDRPH